jgi:peptide chain release factor 2
MKKIREIKSWLEGYNEVKAAADELQWAFDFQKEGITTEEEVDAAYVQVVKLLENLELKNMLRREEDKLGAVLKINSGAGGTEGQDWASMLFRMYQRWCEARGYKVTITNWQDGDEAGIKTATMQVEGEFAYGYLKSENGVHRLVRVSPYNAQGKRMTSFASVFVVPLVDDSIEIDVNPSEVTWDTFRSSGAGGQNVNKVETGVRLHYIYKDEETGEEKEIVIENTESRSQFGNKDNAMRLLKSQLYEIELEKRRRLQTQVEAGK